MTSHGKVLDLLDDRYLDLKDVIGNVEPLPTLVPYEDYAQNVLVYRMDTDHEIFLGLIQDFTFRRAYEVRKELWTWLVQWEVDNSPPVQQPSTAKKVRLDSQQVNTLFKVPPTPRKSPALTIFERRTLDGALMLEEDMLRILIDIVQVASSLVPNFIEFLYRWVDYYEGDGKALKAALRWEIPSLWDFEYHPLVLPRDEEKDDGMGGGIVRASGEREDRARSVSASKAAELRQSSPTKKMHAQPKPDLAAIELQTFYTEESERLQYREVKFGIQPPKLEQALPPLINIPRDVRKRTKYYAACFKSRQRALYLLLEAGLTMRQINNYQKLQTTHPKETPETGDGDGLRNYQKDAKYAQAHYELKEKQIKQREIAISNKLAVEAQFAATHAVPDGAAGLPLIPPTPSYAKKDMAVEMMQRIKQTRARKDDGKINIVPKPLLGLMKSKVFEGAQKVPELAPLRDSMAEAGWYTSSSLTTSTPPQIPRRPGETVSEEVGQETEMVDDSSSDEDNDQDDNDGGDDDQSDDEGDDESDDESDDGGHDESTITAAQPVSAPTLPRPMLPTLLSLHPSPAAVNQTSSLGGSASFATSAASNFQSAPALDRFTPPNIATSMQNLSTEPAQRLLPPLSPQARQAASSSLQQNLGVQSTVSRATKLTTMGPAGPPSSTPLVLPSAPSRQPQALHAPMLIVPVRQQASQSRYATEPIGPSQAVSPTPSPAVGPLTLPRQRASYPSHQSPAPLHPLQSAAPNLSIPPPAGLQRLTIAGGGRSIPAYVLSPTTAQSSTTNTRAPVPVSPSFDPGVFMHLRRQQEAARLATATEATTQPSPLEVPDGQVVLRSSPTVASGLGQQKPAQRQRMLSEVFNSTVLATQTKTTEILGGRDATAVRPVDQGTVSSPTSAAPSASQPLSIPSHLPYESFQQAPVPEIVQDPKVLDPSSTASAQSPSPAAVLPPPRPGIARNAPSPLSLPPPKPSPFTTLAPQILATSPFLAQPVETGTPIQIYLPKILVPGNGIGPGGACMGDSGCIETDALMLGHEDSSSGKLILSKAILLPVGVWENTLRKARAGRWSVLETYACPSSHPAKGKGKRKVGDENKGCHGFVYDKLVQAYSMISSAPEVRENELTKRWRTSPGPMTSFDRGAVWEGWGVYVDRGVEMSVDERNDAMKSEAEAVPKAGASSSSEDYGPYRETDEALRRKREMEELMDEDGEIEEEEEMDD